MSHRTDQSAKQTKTALEIDSLSIEQKIGQMLIARNWIDDNDREDILEMIRNRSLGAVHANTKENARLIEQTADYPILICENMEQGYGKGEISHICPMALGALNDEQAAYDFGRLTAIEAKADGYNVVYGPIVDIAINPLSSCVGPRTFGADKQLVARMANAVIRGYQDNGMVVTAKHFPGFGESEVDSHLGMVYLSADRDTLINRDLYPYISAIKNADLSGVMVGHIMVPSIDAQLPASVSGKLISLLREIGFDGLVMTDSLAMVGMTNMFGLKECHGMAMAAGNDMVMTSYRLRAKTAYNYLLEAYREGTVSEEMINSAVQRVIRAQNRTMKPASQDTISENDKKFAQNVSKSAITVVLREAKQAFINTNERHLFMIETGTKSVDPQTGATIDEANDASEIKSTIRRLFPNSETHLLSCFPSRLEMENASARTLDYSSVVTILQNRSQAYLGSTDISRRILAFIKGLSSKISAAIIFGNPYAARELPPLPRLIFGYELTPFEDPHAEQSALEVLAGKYTSKATLPVALNP